MQPMYAKTINYSDDVLDFQRYSDPSTRRSRLTDDLVDMIYELVLDPSKIEAFMGLWARYIDQLSPDTDDRTNALGASDYLLPDRKLETHFARAQSLLEKIRVQEPQEDSIFRRAEIRPMFEIGRTGKIQLQSSEAVELYGPLKTADQLSEHMDVDTAKSWRAFLEAVKCTPNRNGFEVFSCLLAGNFIAFVRRNEQRQEAWIVIVRLGLHWTAQLNSRLSSDFGLTPREIELVTSLSKVGSLNAICQTTTRSKNTLRVQLKSVFRKMNVNSQAELMQNLSMLSFFCAAISPAKTEDDHGNYPGNLKQIAVSDGSIIPVRLFGPADGRPVILIHGTLDGVGMTAGIQSALERHQIRLIAPGRASLFESSSESDPQDAPRLFAKHLVDIVEQLALQDILLLGYGRGAVYAHAAATQLKRVTCGLVIVAGAVPASSKQSFSTLLRRQKTLAYTARCAPSLLPVIMHTCLRQTEPKDLKRLLQHICPLGLHDSRLIEDPTIANAILEGYRFAANQGCRTLQRDAFHVAHDWSELARSPALPTLLLHGRHDRSVSCDAVITFAKQNAVSLKILEDGGHLIFYEHPDLIVSEIASFLSDLTLPNAG